MKKSGTETHVDYTNKGRRERISFLELVNQKYNEKNAFFKSMSNADCWNLS